MSPPRRPDPCQQKPSPPHPPSACETPRIDDAYAPGSTANLTNLLQNSLLAAERSVTGVITLEDVLEEVIKDEIMDETDVAEAEARGRRGAHANRADISKYLSVFSHKIREQNRLSPQEVDAIAAFLSVTISEFKPFQRHEPVLKGLIRNAVGASGSRCWQGLPGWIG